MKRTLKQKLITLGAYEKFKANFYKYQTGMTQPVIDPISKEDAIKLLRRIMKVKGADRQVSIMRDLYTSFNFFWANESKDYWFTIDYQIQKNWDLKTNKSLEEL
jgi:hypothetical protein